MYILPITFRQLAPSAEDAKKKVEEILPDMVDGSDFANYVVLDAMADGAKIYDGDDKLYGYVVPVEFATFASDKDNAEGAGADVAAMIFDDTDLSGYEIGDAYSDGMNEQADGSLA